MAGNQLIAKLREIYSSASTYADTGSATAIVQGTIAVESHVNFQTTFSRPDFRWDFDSKQPSPVASEIGWIRSDGKRYFYGSNAKEEQSYPQLADVLGVAVARGATQACTFVPSLLFSDSDSTDILSCEYEQLPDEDWQGKPHYRLTAQHENFGLIKVWISKKEYFLSRIAIPAQDLANVMEEIFSNTQIKEQLGSEEYCGNQMLDVLKRKSMLTFDCSFEDIRLNS